MYEGVAMIQREFDASNKRNSWILRRMVNNQLWRFISECKYLNIHQGILSISRSFKVQILSRHNEKFHQNLTNTKLHFDCVNFDRNYLQSISITNQKRLRRSLKIIVFGNRNNHRPTSSLLKQTSFVLNRKFKIKLSPEWSIVFKFASAMRAFAYPQKNMKLKIMTCCNLKCKMFKRNSRILPKLTYF